MAGPAFVKSKQRAPVQALSRCPLNCQAKMSPGIGAGRCFIIHLEDVSGATSLAGLMGPSTPERLSQRRRAVVADALSLKPDRPSSIEVLADPDAAAGGAAAAGGRRGGGGAATAASRRSWNSPPWRSMRPFPCGEKEGIVSVPSS